MRLDLFEMCWTNKNRSDFDLFTWFEEKFSMLPERTETKFHETKFLLKIKFK